MLNANSFRLLYCDWDVRNTCARELLRALGHLTEMCRTLSDSEDRMYDMAHVPGREVLFLLESACYVVEKAEARIAYWSYVPQGLLSLEVF